GGRSAVAPAEVGHPHGRRIAVGEPEHGVLARARLRCHLAVGAARLVEAVRRLDLETGLAALLLVRGDPVAPQGPDRREAQQVRRGLPQRRAAVLALVGPDHVVVEAAAVPAATGAGRGDAVDALLFGRELGGVDDVASAVVVDDRAGAELADADEP